MGGARRAGRHSGRIMAVLITVFSAGVLLFVVGSAQRAAAETDPRKVAGTYTIRSDPADLQTCRGLAVGAVVEVAAAGDDVEVRIPSIGRLFRLTARPPDGTNGRWGSDTLGPNVGDLVENIEFEAALNIVSLDYFSGRRGFATTPDDCYFHLVADRPFAAIPTPAPGPPSSGSLSPGGELAVALACDTSQVEANGAITCVASPSGTVADGDVVFVWTFDGFSQLTNGPELGLEDLRDGPHVVTVQAVAPVAGLSSSIEQLSFTRGAPTLGNSGQGASRGGLPATPRSPLPGIVAVGSAIAIGIAITALVRARRRRAPSVPPAAPATPIGQVVAPVPPPAATTVRPAAPPPSLPSSPPRPFEPGVLPPPTDPGRDHRQRNRPSITVNIQLSGSARTRRPGAIWGDDVDTLVVGYEVVPSPGWSLDYSKARRGPMAGKIANDGVAEDSLQTRGRLEPVDRPSRSHRWRIASGAWYDRDATFDLDIAVTAYLISDQGEEVTAGGTAHATVWVVGADPRVELWRPDGSTPLLANAADRTCIQPTLHLFGQVHAGGLRVHHWERRPVLRTGPIDIDDYLELTVAQDPMRTDPTAHDVEVLDVRAKFHLADKAIRELGDAGVPVAVSVVPTGTMIGGDTVRLAADVDAQRHGARVWDRFRSDPIMSESPLFIQLRPSKLVTEPKAFRALPDLSAKPEERFRTAFDIRVQDADGSPIDGTLLKADRRDGVIRDWVLWLAYERPTDAPLHDWDGPPSGRSRTFDLVDVEPDGTVRVKAAGSDVVQGHCDYDHWAEYFDARRRYLDGQCCDVRVRAEIAGEGYELGTIPIGPACKLYVYVDEGEIGEFTGHVSLGLIDERGKELRVGFYPDRWLNTSFAADVAGPRVLATSGLTLGGSAALGAARLLGLSATSAVSLPAAAFVLASALVIGAAGAAGGATVGGQGVGKLEDDALYKDGQPHNFHVCRGWDISRTEYDTLLDSLKGWKRESDLGNTWYNLALHLLTGSRAPYEGNCCTLFDDHLAQLKAPDPFPAAASQRRPGIYGEALRAGDRSEMPPDPENTGSYRHPWRYRRGLTPGFLDMAKTLGVTKRPPPPPPPTVPNSPGTIRTVPPATTPPKE